MSITINGIDDKIRAIEGTGKRTPIKMSELDNRINNLQNKTGYAEHTFSREETWTMPVGYDNADIFFTCSAGWEMSIATSHTSKDGNITFDFIKTTGEGAYSNRVGTVQFTRSGRNLTGRITRNNSWAYSIRAICIPK